MNFEGGSSVRPKTKKRKRTQLSEDEMRSKLLKQKSDNQQKKRDRKRRQKYLMTMR